MCSFEKISKITNDVEKERTYYLFVRESKKKISQWVMKRGQFSSFTFIIYHFILNLCQK